MSTSKKFVLSVIEPSNDPALSYDEDDIVGGNGIHWFGGTGSPAGTVDALAAGDIYVQCGVSPSLWMAGAPGSGDWQQQGSGGGGTSSVQIIDLGLVNLVDAVMNGPQTLYDMPEGSFLASIRFTDDPDSVVPDFGAFGSITVNPDGGPALAWLAIGTEKSFGWSGFAGIYPVAPDSPDTFPATYDTLSLSMAGPATTTGSGYGPFAALDAGANDLFAIVLSAAAVGPIVAGLTVTDSSVEPNNGSGSGGRVGPITAWAALTNYDSPASNTVATPGVLQSCAILANGTIWINDGVTGTSGGSAPDFAGNAGGSVSDGPDIVWYDTTSAPPTVGAVHVVAEIWTPVSP